MPELPDLTVYREALAARVVGRILARVAIRNPFVLRSVAPPISDVAGRRVIAIELLGKRIVFELESGLFLLIHLMIAGRLHWKASGAKPPGRIALAILEFESGRLVLTEAGSKRRASLHFVQGEENLARYDAGGLVVLSAHRTDFERALKRENHTLKRSLTDPHIFSGIGNAYSDEILHRARLSPFTMSAHMTADETDRLFEATRAILREWTDRLRSEARGAFPENVTAFHPEMAVHGRFGKPCPVCTTAVQRIVYAENEANYCPRCQTEGRILADRALSRLLRDEWPRTIEELEELRPDCG